MIRMKHRDPNAGLTLSDGSCPTNEKDDTGGFMVPDHLIGDAQSHGFYVCQDDADDIQQQAEAQPGPAAPPTPAPGSMEADEARITAASTKPPAAPEPDAPTEPPAEATGEAGEPTGDDAPPADGGPPSARRTRRERLSSGGQ